MTRRKILTLFGMVPALVVPLKPLSNDDKRIIDVLRNGKRVDTLRAQVDAGKAAEFEREQLLGLACSPVYPGGYRREHSPFGDIPERMGRSARKSFDADCVALLTCTAINPGTNTITLE
jgi:hypothetical protein